MFILFIRLQTTVSVFMNILAMWQNKNRQCQYGSVKNEKFPHVSCVMNFDTGTSVLHPTLRTTTDKRYLYHMSYMICVLFKNPSCKARAV